MEQDKLNVPESNENRGSSPIPDEALNRGDGNYDETKAKDKEYLRNKMDENMPLPTTDQKSDK